MPRTSISGKDAPCSLPSDQATRELLNQCVGTHMSKCTDDYMLYKYSRFLNRLAALQTGAVVLDREKWKELFEEKKTQPCMDKSASMFSLSENADDCFPGVNVIKPKVNTFYMKFLLLQTHERNNFTFLYHDEEFQKLWKLNRRVGAHMARLRLKKLKESPITQECYVILGSKKGKQWKDCKENDSAWHEAVLLNVFLPEIARRAVAPNVTAYNHFVGRAMQHLRDFANSKINIRGDRFKLAEYPVINPLLDKDENIFNIIGMLTHHESQKRDGNYRYEESFDTILDGMIELQFQNLLKASNPKTVEELEFVFPSPFEFDPTIAINYTASQGEHDFGMLLWAAQRHNMAVREAKYKFELLRDLLVKAHSKSNTNVGEALIGKINLMHIIQDARTQSDVLNQFLPDIDCYTLCNRIELENVMGVYIECAENNCASDAGINKNGSVVFPKIKTVLGLHDFVTSTRSRKTNILTDTIFSQISAKTPPSAASGGPGGIKTWDISVQARCKAFHANTPAICFDAYIESEQRKCEAYNMQYKGKDLMGDTKQMTMCKSIGRIGCDGFSAAMNPLIPRYLSWVHLIPEGSVTWVIDTSLPGKIHVIHPFWETTDTVLRRKRGGKKKSRKKTTNPSLQELTTVPDLEHAMSHMYLPPSVCVTNPLMNFETHCMQVFEANKISCNLQFGKL